MFGIGLRINQLRESKNLSQVAFADKVGVHRNQVKNLEGDGNFGLDMVHKILCAFPDIDRDWLLTGKGSMIKNAVSEPEDAGDYAVNRKAETQAAFAEASLDAIAEELSDAERRLLFDTTQQLRQFKYWRSGIEESLSELREEIRQLKEAVKSK